MPLEPTAGPTPEDLRAALEALDQGLLLYDGEGRLLFANARAAALLGVAADGGRAPRAELHDAHGQPLAFERLGTPGPEGQYLSGEKVRAFRQDTGEESWLTVTATPSPSKEGLRVVTTLRELPPASREALDLHLLAEVSALLGASFDPRATLRAVAHRLVPEVADGCVVELLGDGDRHQPGALVFLDPAREERMRQLARRYGAHSESPFGTARVSRTGEPVLRPTFGEEDLRQAGLGEAQVRDLAAEGIHSVVSVPLVARDHTLGVLTLVHVESGRRFGPADLAVAREVASRVALVLEHSRLHQRAEDALRRKEEEARANDLLCRLGMILSAELDPERLTHRITREATLLAGAEAGAFLRGTAEGGRSSGAAALSGARAEGLARFALAHAPALFAPDFRGDVALRSDDIRTDPRFDPGDEADPPAVASFLAVPITTHAGEVLGRLIFGHSQPGLFTAEQERILLNLAAQAAVALDNARLFQQVRDAEERSRFNEERLQLALESGQMGFYDWDLVTGRALMSPRLEELFGLRPGEYDGTYEMYQRLLHPEDAKNSSALVQELIRDPTRRSIVFQHRTAPGPDGAYRWLEASSRCVRDASGAPRRVLGVVLDVTERRLAEQAREAHAAELARSNSELEQFAYVASHDLQEPLRMVASYTQLLARRYRGRLDSDADQFIGFAVDGVTRMKRLIGDLLAYSRVGTQGKSMQPVACDMALQRALANLRTAIEESGAAVTATPLPTVQGDPTQLEQLLQNLIGNALKFRTEAPPRIHVAAERQGDGWRFSVADNGIGIDPQYHERIFVIFQRLHTHDQYAGTGIGLAICKKIVERHRGRIWVESALGRGSTFFFTLPAQAAAEGRAQQSA